MQAKCNTLHNAIVLKDTTLKDRDWLWFKFSSPNKETEFTDVVNGLQFNGAFMENERFAL